MYYVPDGTKECGYYECKKCGNRFLSLQTMKRIPCPDCEQEIDYEIGPDESLEDVLDTAEFTLCYGLHDCSHLFQGYFIHSLSTLYYYNAPSLTIRLTGNYRSWTFTNWRDPASLGTREEGVGNS